MFDSKRFIGKSYSQSLSDYFENGNSITYIFPNENSNIEELETLINNQVIHHKSYVLLQYL